jgi:hypothetical protein
MTTFLMWFLRFLIEEEEWALWCDEGAAEAAAAKAKRPRRALGCMMNVNGTSLFPWNLERSLVQGIAVPFIAIHNIHCRQLGGLAPNERTNAI